MGAGVGLIWHAPIRIATDTTLYAMPETQIGFFTDNGGSYLLTRLLNGDTAVGLYLALTGQAIRGSDLCKYGLATHYIPEEVMD
jgi:3-hydroxyisobutyryl-CoA hydrolase